MPRRSTSSVGVGALVIGLLVPPATAQVEPGPLLPDQTWLVEGVDCTDPIGRWAFTSRMTHDPGSGSFSNTEVFRGRPERYTGTWLGTDWTGGTWSDTWDTATRKVISTTRTDDPLVPDYLPSGLSLRNGDAVEFFGTSFRVSGPEMWLLGTGRTEERRVAWELTNLDAVGHEFGGALTGQTAVGGFSARYDAALGILIESYEEQSLYDGAAFVMNRVRSTRLVAPEFEGGRVLTRIDAHSCDFENGEAPARGEFGISTPDREVLLLPTAQASFPSIAASWDAAPGEVVLERYEVVVSRDGGAWQDYRFDTLETSIDLSPPAGSTEAFTAGGYTLEVGVHDVFPLMSDAVAYSDSARFRVAHLEITDPVPGGAVEATGHAGVGHLDVTWDPEPAKAGEDSFTLTLSGGGLAADHQATVTGTTHRFDVTLPRGRYDLKLEIPGKPEYTTTSSFAVVSGSELPAGYPWWHPEQSTLCPSATPWLVTNQGTILPGTSAKPQCHATAADADATVPETLVVEAESFTSASANSSVSGTTASTGSTGTATLVYDLDVPTDAHYWMDARMTMKENIIGVSVDGNEVDRQEVPAHIQLEGADDAANHWSYVLRDWAIWEFSLGNLSAGSHTLEISVASNRHEGQEFDWFRIWRSVRARKLLTTHYHEQENQYTCYAAVAHNFILTEAGVNISQADFSKKAFGDFTGGQAYSGAPGIGGGMSPAWKGDYESAIEDLSGLTLVRDDDLTWDEIKASIDAGHPMIAALGMDAWGGSGNYHMVMVVGYGWSGPFRYIYENNPIPGIDPDGMTNRYAVNPNEDPETAGPRHDVTHYLKYQSFGWRVWP